MYCRPWACGGTDAAPGSPSLSAFRRVLRKLKGNQSLLFDALDALNWENIPVNRVMHDCSHGRGETPVNQVLPPRTACPARRPDLHDRAVRRDPGGLRCPRHQQPYPGTRRDTGVRRPSGTRPLGDRGLHHVRDATMKEDAQRFRAATSAQAEELFVSFNGSYASIGAAPHTS
jgi:hypothetical protein